MAEKNIAALCAQELYCSSYIYSQAHRIAAQWLREHQPVAANPVINHCFDRHDTDSLNLCFALREAYVAGMVMGSCLQKDEHENKPFRV